MSQSNLEIRCILCNVANEVFLDTEDCKTFTCTACDSDFTLVDVETVELSCRALIAISEAARAAKDKVASSVSG